MGDKKDDEGEVTGTGPTEDERRFLGVEADHPHPPIGGSPFAPRRGRPPPGPPPQAGEGTRSEPPPPEGPGEGQATAAAAGCESGPARGEGSGTCDFDHGHGHGHGGREVRGLFKALALTTTVLFVVAIGGVVSGSLALLSDAGHMLTDVSALILALFAIRLAARPKTAAKTFGWYRLEILAALANGVALLVIAGIIVHEAIQRLGTVPEVDSGVMMGVALIGLMANLGGLWFLHRDRHGSLNVRGAFLHILSDALSSVTVLIGGALIFFTGIHLIDPILSLLISLIIVVGAGRLVWEAVDVLLEATPGHLDHTEVASAIAAVEGVCGVHDLHIWTITSGMYALSVHVVVPEEKIAESNELLRRVKKVLLDRYEIDHTTVQIESVGYEHVGSIC